MDFDAGLRKNIRNYGFEPMSTGSGVCLHERMLAPFGLISRFFRLSSLPCASKAASLAQNNHKSPSKKPQNLSRDDSVLRNAGFAAVPANTKN
jgi:hypothetical protein